MTVASHGQLTSEVNTQVPSGTPSVLTAAAMRIMLHDMVDSYFVWGSTLSGITMTTYQPFTNTASASSNAVALQIFDGSVGVTFGILNSAAHTIALTSGASITATGGISSGSSLSVTGSVVATLGISSGSAGGTGGSLTLNGSVSGSAVLSANSTGTLLLNNTLAMLGTSSGAVNIFPNSTASSLNIISSVNVTSNINPQSNTSPASTASQAMAMGSAGPSIYFSTGQPTVSSATQGSLCLSTGGTGPSTRVWVAGSTGNWIGVVAEA